LFEHHQENEGTGKAHFWQYRFLRQLSAGDVGWAVLHTKAAFGADPDIPNFKLESLAWKRQALSYRDAHKAINDTSGQ
jgi:hypothetical protein